MICLIQDNTIVVGPVACGDSAIQQAIYIAGYTETESVLRDHEGTEWPSLPMEEPTAPVDMGNGFAIVPVVFETPAIPDGKVISGVATFVVGGTVTVGPVFTDAPVPVLADVKATKQAEITAKANAFLAQFSGEYGEFERATWDQQAVEAAAVTVNPDAPTPMLTPMADARGMEVSALAQRILANGAAWKMISGHVVGQRLAYQDKLDAAQDVETVESIIVTYSLPASE